MVRHNVAVKHIYNTGQKKVSALTSYVSIFYIHLPKLVRSGNHSIIRDLPGNSVGFLSLRGEEIQCFTESVHLLFVNEQTMFSSQKDGELSVAKRTIFPLYQASQPCFNVCIFHLCTCLVVGKPRDRTAFTDRLLRLWMLEAVVVRRTRNPANPQNGTHGVALSNPMKSYFQSGYFFFTKSRRIWISSSFSPRSLTASSYFFWRSWNCAASC